MNAGEERGWSGHAADEQLFHAIGWVAWVVRAFDHVLDSRDERGDGIVGVLVAGVAWEWKFVDRCSPMVPYGGMHCEAGVCLG